MNKDEIKHFIIMLHGGEIKSNAQEGLKSLESAKEVKDGRYTYRNIVTLNRNFPHLFYPAFRLQGSMMRSSWGERWWQSKIFTIQVETAERRRKQKGNIAAGGKGVMTESDMIKEEIEIKTEMGIVPYYLFRWKREAVRNKLRKLAAFEEEMRLREIEDRMNGVEEEVSQHV